MTVEDVVKAQIELLPSAAGGLKAPVASPTRSLILVFPSLDPDEPGDVQIGALITTSAPMGELRPAESCPVELDFWAEVGWIYATPGQKFDIWYAGRVVGSGVVLAADEGKPTRTGE